MEKNPQNKKAINQIIRILHSESQEINIQQINTQKNKKNCEIDWEVNIMGIGLINQKQPIPIESIKVN